MKSNCKVKVSFAEQRPWKNSSHVNERLFKAYCHIFGKIVPFVKL